MSLQEEDSVKDMLELINDVRHTIEKTGRLIDELEARLRGVPARVSLK